MISIAYKAKFHTDATSIPMSNNGSSPRDEISRIGQVVRHLRRETGLDQRDLAAQAGLDLTTLQSIEDGSGDTLSLSGLARIAKAFDLPLSILLDGGTGRHDAGKL